MNETLFREINERVAAQVVEVRGEDESFVIACECGDMECTERLWVTPAEYEAIHADPAQFIVVEDHAVLDIEDIVSRNDRYVVVRKLGLAGESATELPKSPE